MRKAIGTVVLAFMGLFAAWTVYEVVRASKTSGDIIPEDDDEDLGIYDDCDLQGEDL